MSKVEKEVTEIEPFQVEWGNKIQTSKEFMHSLSMWDFKRKFAHKSKLKRGMYVFFFRLRENESFDAIILGERVPQRGKLSIMIKVAGELEGEVCVVGGPPTCQ